MKTVVLLTLTLAAAAAAAGTIHPALQAQLDRAGAQDRVGAIVMLTEQAPIARLDAELRHARASRLERHRAVIHALQEAARAQAPLLRDLDDGRHAGTVAGYTAYWIANLVVVQATPAEILRLAARDDVDFVEPNFAASLVAPVARDAVAGPALAIGVPPGIRAVRAPEVWYDLGYTGAGRLVGSFDTGVDSHHPALASRWRGLRASSRECWLDVLGFATDAPTDRNGHGTHTTGTMTGVAPDDTIGVAWQAEWIACNAIGQSVNPDFDNDVVASFQWFADPDGNPATLADVPDVVQNSWGVTESFPGYVDCDNRWWSIIDNCEAAGVALLFSAGNNGSAARSIGSPADRATTTTNCFAVGAVNATAYEWPYPIASFSSRGPTGCSVPTPNRIKPEVVAPGVHVYSSVPSGGYEGNWDGTSMAGPHVAGIVALMRQADPDLEVDAIKQILLASARDEGAAGEDNTFGWGFVDARAALDAVIAGFGQLTGTVRNASQGGAPLPGASVLLLDHGYLFAGDDAGAYTGRAAPGVYTARASAPGFASQDAVVTVVGDQVTVQDFALVDEAGPAFTDVTAPAAVADTDGAVTVGARVADGSGVASVHLWYRGGEGAWQAIEMSPARGEYLANLPPFAAPTRVELYLQATDGAGLQSVWPSGAPAIHHELRVCEVRWADAAEDPGDPGWQFGAPGDLATEGLWVREDPVGTFDGDLAIQPEDDHTAPPGVACFLTGNCAPGDPYYVNDVNGGCTTLVSPPLDLAGADAAYVEYWRWYAEAGNAYDDAFAVDVSGDGGATWVALERVLDSTPAWTPALVDLAPLVPLTGEVRLRFVACNEGEPGIVEAAIDDVRVLTFRDELTPVPPQPPAVSRLALEPNRPNPFNPLTVLVLALPAPGPARVRIYDLAGRLVRTLLDAPDLAAGRHEVTWDGRDDAGRAMAAGVYVGRVEAGGEAAVRQMVLIR